MAGTLAPGVLVLEFDPLLGLGDLAVRWQALGLALGLVLALALWLAGLRASMGAALRFDDAAFILLGAIPGAVVGGRLVHGLAFSTAYALDPAALLDLGRGSLSLLGAVLGGLVTAGYVCRLLGGRVGPWADAAAAPLLLAIGLGKVAMLLGAAGQGAATDGPLALAFGGAGPWVSADAATPSHPSQVLEGLWSLLGVIPAWLLARRRHRSRSASGLALVGAVAWWLAGRALSAVTWRDETALGPLGVEGLAASAALAGCAVIAVVANARGDGARRTHAT